MQQSITCPKCGSPNALGQRFCWNCGTTLGTGCPNCGASLDPGARFCGNCGAQLPGMQQPAGWGQPPSPQQPPGWGQPPPPPPQQPGAWGPPPPQQPGGWGQPPPPPQQPGAWGQPPPPQQPGGWGSPPGGMPQAGAWGQPVQRRKSGAGGLIILLIVLLIGLGTLGYFAFFSPNPPWSKTPSGSTTGTTTSAITSGPFVFAVSTDNSTSTAKMEIKWETTDLYKGQVEYGTGTSYGSTSELESDLVKSHVASLTDLQMSTSYHYRIVLKNKDNIEWKSNDFTFATPKPPE